MMMNFSMRYTQFLCAAHGNSIKTSISETIAFKLLVVLCHCVLAEFLFFCARSVIIDRHGALEMFNVVVIIIIIIIIIINIRVM